jgi:hypothetical protein
VGDPVPVALPPPATGTGTRSRRGLFIPMHIHSAPLHLVLTTMQWTGDIGIPPVEYPQIGPGLCRIADMDFRLV